MDNDATIDTNGESYADFSPVNEWLNEQPGSARNLLEWLDNRSVFDTWRREHK